MVCIAAFIILAIIGVFVAFISIFKRDFGKRYLKVFKKAWGCVGKKVRLQKCETGFKEDVKNTVLSKVIIKHPNWVRPLSIIMEVVSVIIVAITVWSIATAIKSLLALWALGTCNVTQPAACSFNGGSGCGVNKEEPKNIIEATGRWFTEWGDIFAAFPDKFRDWNPEQFDFTTITVEESNQDGSLAIDIIDPGCSYCLNSYKNQKNTGFFEKYNVKLVIYPIYNPDGTIHFRNSEIIARYIYAAAKINNKVANTIIEKIFFEKTADEKNGDILTLNQNMFNNQYDEEKTVKVLDEWSKEADLTDNDLKTIHKDMNSEEISNILAKNKKIIEEEVHANLIPTMLYNNSKHSGLFENE